jgi:hypothetical protein
MSKFFFSKEEYIQSAGLAFVLTSFLLFGFYAYHVQGEAVSLTVTVSSALSFTSSTDQFGTLTPGTFKIATTTLSVTTNANDGYNITLYGDDQSTSDTVMDLTTNASTGITDQTEWIPGGGITPATTTTGNAVVRGSLDSSGDVLAFRVYSSTTPAFYSTSWWGATNLVGVAKWAGIPSSTVQRRIGNVQSKGGGNSVYNSSEQLITIAYYLDVPTTQVAGSYSGGLTYTATAN